MRIINPLILIGSVACLGMFAFEYLATRNPIVHFEIQNCGPLDQLNTVDLIATIKNNSNRNVVIERLFTPCSCLSMGSFPISLGPKESQTINLSLYTGLKSGEQNLDLTYCYRVDDGEASTQCSVYSFHFNVNADIMYSTANVFNANFSARNWRTVRVNFVSRSRREFRVIRVAAIDRNEDDRNRNFSIDIKSDSSVDISFSSEEQPLHAKIEVEYKNGERNVVELKADSE